jgi:hypothetical protein
VIFDAAHTIISLILSLPIALIGWNFTEKGHFDPNLAGAKRHLFFLSEISQVSLLSLCSSWFHLFHYFI